MRGCNDSQTRFVLFSQYLFYIHLRFFLLYLQIASKNFSKISLKNQQSCRVVPNPISVWPWVIPSSLSFAHWEGSSTGVQEARLAQVCNYALYLTEYCTLLYCTQPKYTEQTLPTGVLGANTHQIQLSDIRLITASLHCTLGGSAHPTTVKIRRWSHISDRPSQL